MQLENISKFRNIYFSTQQYICIYNNDQTFAIDYRKRKITTALLLLIGITSIHFSRLKRFHKKERLLLYCAPKNIMCSYSIQTNYLSCISLEFLEIFHKEGTTSTVDQKYCVCEVIQTNYLSVVFLERFHKEQVMC